MTLRRMTLAEARFPNSPEFAEIQSVLTEAVVVQMLTLVWEAWDKVSKTILSGLDLSVADDQLERSLNDELERAIQERLTRQEPYQVQHESYEFETRRGGRARPPQYDIAFILRKNQRVKWPIEAKVLPTDGQVAEYVKDIKEAFLTCVYAPFTSGGAMVGYLRAGSVNTAFHEIANHLQPDSLDEHQHFSNRPHKVSSHQRSVPVGKPYVRGFQCHHLLMKLSVETPPAQT
ncbi:hypothetical protein [Myxococcus fulvus]|uniref:hypothetical protein n=1 Tax=Myxococcus fulvus TaxID=33 RepID=UPI0020C11659|nr:hypothetical protein [Myxococcus fulvus]MCK8502587.1 hypothetical protein [Myxococcus fulvus]